MHAIKDKNLYDVVVDGMTSREQPLSVITTTSGTVREGIYDLKYDECEQIINGYDDGLYVNERVLPIIYELDSTAEYIDEKCWQKANPGLGTIKNTEQLAEKVYKAKKNPRLRPNLLCKDFNIAQNGESTWLTFEEVKNEDTFNLLELKPNYVIGGADLSKNGDLTAACIAFKLPNDDNLYVESMYWLPADILEERVKEDGVPYDIWHEQGYLRLCEGNTISYKDITSWFVEIQEKYDAYMYMIGYDRWSAKYWVEEMENNFGRSTMVDVAQGAKTFSLPMMTLEAMFKKGKVNYNNNPITRWCLMNTSVEVDKNENIRPIKGNNQRKRIDGMVAMLDAFVVMEENRNEYNNRIG